MEKKYLKTLEYDKVLGMVALHAHSDIAARSISGLMPETDINKVRELLLETKDVIELLFRKGRPSLGGINDIADTLARLSKGAYLNNSELMGIRDNLFITRNTRLYLEESNPDFEQSGRLIKEKLRDLYTNKELEQEIQRCIISEEEMADDASVQLRNIRHSIRRKQDEIRDRLNEYIRSSKYSKFIQDNVVTIRSGRYVIPVKQEFRSNIKGLVHDSSSSGSTVYIEPMDVVNLNNDVKNLEQSEKEEMDRIRAVLSDRTRPYIEELRCNYRLLLYADIAFAKADLAADKNYMVPSVTDERRMRLVKAKHPLIDAKDVVPIDFHIGEEFNILVITGPNTGGKTVSLKTVGLLTAMAQTGLPVPAGESTEICVFKDIFADIGDEQSIEQSLSTFSSHMTNIISILSNCSSDSLVLLDELGAGTDPIEGSALALAIIEDLMDKNTLTVATTHYQHIKMYASVTEGIENASCEFDVRTLRPTYRLLIGIPGKSNALYISRRLGLNNDIIEKAKSFIDNDNIDYEDIILSLEKSRQRIEKERTKALVNSKEIRLLKADLERQLKGIEGERKKIINESKREAGEILEASRKAADDFMEELSKLKKEGLNRGSAREEADFRNKYNKTYISEDKNSHVNTSNELHSDSDYIPFPGEEVMILDINSRATVLEPPDKGNEVLVQAGIMKIKVKSSNLSRLSSIEKSRKAANTFSLEKSSQKPSLELDIRGIASDEVNLRVDKFIDDSSIMSINEVSIIHGKGTGTLRKTVHSCLKENPHVKRFRLGTFGEGETGVTIVELKS